VQFHPQERRLLDFFIDTDSAVVVAVPSHVLVVLLDPTSPTFIDAFNGISPALFCVHNPEPTTLQRLGIAPHSDRPTAYKCRLCGAAVRADAFVEHIIRDGARVHPITN
jgi:hypothetical protein